MKTIILNIKLFSLGIAIGLMPLTAYGMAASASKMRNAFAQWEAYNAAIPTISATVARWNDAIKGENLKEIETLLADGMNPHYPEVSLNALLKKMRKRSKQYSDRAEEVINLITSYIAHGAQCTPKTLTKLLRIGWGSAMAGLVEQFLQQGVVPNESFIISLHQVKEDFLGDSSCYENLKRLAESIMADKNPDGLRLAYQTLKERELQEIARLDELPRYIPAPENNLSLSFGPGYKKGYYEIAAELFERGTKPTTAFLQRFEQDKHRPKIVDPQLYARLIKLIDSKALHAAMTLDSHLEGRSATSSSQTH